MAKQIYNEKINRDTAWGGDASTGGLPVAGGRVQEFIKDELKTKAGAFYRPGGGNFVYCFATKEDKDLFIQTGNESLIIDSFETESNYSVYINQETLVLSKSVIEGSTGNTVSFQFKIADKNGMVSDSKASIVFSFLASGVIKKYTTEVQVKSEGWTTVVSDVIDKYLRNGENTISITITGLSTKTSTQFVMTYNVFDLTYNVNFVYNIVKNGNTMSIPYYVSCTETKYLEFYIDGVLTNSFETMVISDASKDGTATIDISRLAHGQHTLQTRAYVKANDGTKFYSNIYYYSFAVAGEASPSFLVSILLENDQEVAIDGNNLVINTTQFSQLSFNWSLYDNLNRRLVVIFEYDGSVLQKSVFTSNGSVSEFSFRPLTDGKNKELRVYALDENENTVFENIIAFNVDGTSGGIKETVDGLLLKLTSIGRRNTDEDKSVWSCVGNDGNEYYATFNNFSWNAQQGWNPEYEALVISDDAYVDFNIQPMINHWEVNGGTFEVDLETFDIEDDDAVICECTTDIEGKSSAFFRITATNAEFSTADGKKINTRYKDNERLKIAFIGNKIGNHEDGNLIYIVVNGVLERAAIYESTDKIFSDSYLKIGTGNGGCKVRVRSIRVYDRAISVDEEFNNYVVDSNDSQIIYENNNVFKPGTNEVGFDEIANKLPVMIFTGDMDDLTKNGQDKEWRYFDVEYINRQEPERNFVSFNCQMKLQGTSSLGYPRKNFKLKTKDKLATQEYYESSNYELDTEETEVGNRRLRNKITGRLIDFGELKGNCYTFDSEGKLLKKGKYRFREQCHKADKWTLKADYMESSCSHNVGAGRSWNDIFENTKFTVSDYAGYKNNTYRDSALVNKNPYSEYEKNGVSYKINMNTDAFANQKDYVCRTDAQKICHAENADDIRTAIDGFPMVCFYRTSHAENNLVFMGQYNFINDKGSYEVFGFEDIEDPNNEDVMIYDATQVECWEGLKNANPISLFKTVDGWMGENGWKSTFDSRYPDPDDEGKADKRQVDASIGSPLYELCSWLVSTRHESDTVYGDTINVDAYFARRINGYQYAYVPGSEESYAYFEGTNLPDNAENRQKKFETEKWEHFDVWKLAGYYVYLMRYGAVDQFVKNTMLFTDGNGRYDPRPDKKYRKWFYINYDNDCLFGLRNNGELAFHWDLDRQTLDNANGIIVDENYEHTEEEDNTYAMMGHDSTLWNNLERDDEFMRMVRDLDDSMSKNGLNYNNMVTEFDTKQTEMWCERIYNANERYKYIQAAKGVGDMSGNPVDNLWMLQGTRRSHRHWWIANHFNLLDAKWLSGEYKNTYVEIKTDASTGSKIRAIAGTNYYFAWGQQKKIYESNIEKNEGDEIVFTFDTDQVQGDPVYIYAINKMSEMDFSEIANKIAAGSFEFHVGNTNIANTLKRLIIGNPTVENRIEGIVTSSWGCLTNLEYLDITNYLGIKIVPLDEFSNLHVFKAFGSGIKSFAPKEGSSFDLVELPNTVSTIKLNNIKFESLAGSFKYTPTTNLEDLEISNTNGIDNQYYEKIVVPWIDSINRSASSDRLFAEASLNLNNVNWSFNNIDSVRIFKKIKQLGSFVITGIINLSDCGNLSIDNIEEIKEIFGENCFSEKMSAIYVKTPESVFIQTNNDSMVAGKTNEFNRELYPDENVLSGVDHTISYHIVVETDDDPTLNPDVIVDVLDGTKYLIVDDLSTVRNGLELTTESQILSHREIGVLRSVEAVENSDTRVKVMCMLKIGHVKKVSVCDFTILDPTYAVRGSISGEKSLYKIGSDNEYPEGEYIFTMNLFDRFGKEPIGTEIVEWSVSMNDIDTYLNVSECGNVDSNGHQFKIKTTMNQPEISEQVKLTANVYNGNGVSITGITFNALLLNENVIVTSESNPTVMRICAQQEWSEGNLNAMTKQQAEAVTSIGTVFSGVYNEYTFNEFKFFKNVTEIEAGAFGNSKITEITLHEDITSIGESAFAGCDKLTKITTANSANTLPDITVINSGTFKNCALLNKLILPETVNEIKEFSFGGSGIRKVLLHGEELTDGALILPSSIEKISKNAFEYANWAVDTTNSKITVFSIPISLKLDSELEVLYGKEIKEYIAEEGENAKYLTVDGVLYNNGKTTLIKYPAKKNYVETFSLVGSDLQTIDNYAFLFVSNLDNVVLPGSLTSAGIGWHCFERSNIKVVDMSISNNLSQIPAYCFYFCHSLTDVILPKSSTIKSIGTYSFYDCPMLTGLTLTEGIISFGVHRENTYSNVGRNFYNCGFTEFKFPDSVTEMGMYLIDSCRNLVKVELPKNGIMNAYNVVSNCPNLIEVKLPVFSYYETIQYNVYDSDGVLVNEVPYDKYDVAYNAMPEGGYIQTLYGDNIVVNGNYPRNSTTNYEFVNGCPNLNKFILNESDNNLVFHEHDGCLYKNGENSALLVKVPFGKNDVDIEDNTYSADTMCFYGCGKITSVTFPDTIKIVGTMAFEGCNSLEYVNLGNGVQTITYAMFRSCSSLKTLICGKSTALFDTNALQNCSELSNVYVFNATAPTINRMLNGNDRHPFGYSGGNYAGYSHRNENINKLYVPYNSIGYDADVWQNPIVDTLKCGYTYKFIPLNYNFRVKIYDENGNAITNECVYAVSESGNFAYGEHNYSTGMKDGDAYLFVASNDLYHNEVLTIYSDSDCLNELGNLTMDYFVDAYQIGEPLLGSRRLSKSVENNEEETIVMTKKDYDKIMSNLETLNKLIIGK